MYYLPNPKPPKSADTRKARLSKTQPVSSVLGDSAANSSDDENSIDETGNMQSILIVNEMDNNHHFKTEGNESEVSDLNLFTALSMSFYERRSLANVQCQRGKRESNEQSFQNFRPNMKLEVSTPAKKVLDNNHERRVHPLVTPRCLDKTELFPIVELNSASHSKKKLLSPESKLQKEAKKGMRQVLEEKKIQKNNVRLDSKERSSERVITGVMRKIDMGTDKVKKPNLAKTTIVGNLKQQAKKEEFAQKVKRSAIVSTKPLKGKENAVRSSKENHADILNKTCSLKNLDAKKTTSSVLKRDTGVVSFKGTQRLPLHRLQIDLSGTMSSTQRLTTDPGSMPQSTRSERSVKESSKKVLGKGKENLNVDKKQVGSKKELDKGSKNKATAVKHLEIRLSDDDCLQNDSRFQQSQAINSAREHYFADKGPGWQSYFKTTLTHVLEPSNRGTGMSYLKDVKFNILIENSEHQEKGCESARTGANTAR